VTDIRGARITRLVSDTECGGDLLALGCALAAFLDFGLRGSGKVNSEDVARQTWSTSDMYRFRFKETIRKDARTYKPPRMKGICVAPMIRRDGVCGSTKVVTSGYLWDWATGEATYSGACRRHADWHSSEHRANYAARPPDGERVLAAANHGGVLARHFPEFDWPKMWKWADPSWVEHPEVRPWPKPTLTLHLGNGEDDNGARPMLGLVRA
jgi:hypothetical protein